MYLKQILISSENYLEQLSIKHKVLFFTLPILIVAYLFYLLNTNNLLQNKSIHMVDYKESLNNRFNEVANKEQIIEFLKSCEDFTNRIGIRLHSTKIENKKLLLNTTGTINQLLEFIHFIENSSKYTRIVKYRLSKKKTIYELKLEINFKNWWIKNHTKLIIPKKNKKESFKKSKSDVVIFKLHAIVGEYIFINNRWLQKGDKLLEYEVNKITSSYVELKNEHITKIIKLRKERDAK